MSLLDKIFNRPKKTDAAAYFKTLSGYTPVFTNYDGGLYEMELTRAAINARAIFASKLKPEITGTAKRHLEYVLQYQPNPWMDTSKFLYRLSTILDIHNTAFIIPLEDDSGALAGYYPVAPACAEIVELQGVTYVRYTFGSGRRAAIELARCGILTQLSYKNDFFGETNAALKPTLQLLHAQTEGMVDAIRTSAVVRFLAKMTTFLQPEDVTAIREDFANVNLDPSNKSGLLVQDSRISDLKQITPNQYTVNAAQQKLIQENVYQYFGVSMPILENTYTEDQWNAYYEGRVEPFALQLSLVLSTMTYSRREIGFGNGIMFTSNRLQYASNTTKLNMVSQLTDRGLITRNEAREILNLPPIGDDSGDKFYMRREYAEISQIGAPAESAIQSEEVNGK